MGDLTSLNTHAIVNSTNENLTDKSPLSQRIVERAGEQLRRDMLNEIRSECTYEATSAVGLGTDVRTGGERASLRTLLMANGICERGRQSAFFKAATAASV